LVEPFDDRLALKADSASSTADDIGVRRDQSISS
jgi:hypothetical protein